MISRRAFMAGIGLGMPMVRRAHAQGAAKIPKVGFLINRFGSPQHLPVFTRAIRDVGYVPGRTLLIEEAVGDPARPDEFRDLASHLVGNGVDVILAAGPQSIEAARAASSSIPIVGVDLESDPVAKGWAATLARPGGNFTGFFLDIPELSGKQLQFLMEAKPKLTRVAVLGDSRFNDLQFKATESAARMVGLALVTLPITTTEEIASAIGEATRQRADALVALTSPLMFTGLAQVAEHALKHRLATICPFVPFFAAQGGLLAYGPDFPDIFRRSADYIDRVLKGAKPGDLPIQRPIKFELAVNLKTARALNLTIPRVLLARADRVIDK